MIGTIAETNDPIAGLLYVGGLLIGGAVFGWLLFHEVKSWWFVGLCLISSSLATIMVFLSAKWCGVFLTGFALTGIIFIPVRFMERRRYLKPTG